MKILLSWLNDYIETGLSAEEIAEILSNLGFPNEGIEHLNGDAVIDVEVTSNRGDCLGYIGIARELAAATGKRLKLPQIKLAEGEKKVEKFADVEIAEPQLCRRYTARVIEGVKVAPSPDWLKKRLEAVGMRSVNNVVDATNYAMLETGQPPHAFDYDKIIDGKIIVRKAKAGEQIVSIDGTKCQLNPDMLVIADAKRTVAIAGVMGGLDTEVGENTTKILLEDAYFDPVSVRTTDRRLALHSEAAFRFERIVDVKMVDWASKRTAQLIIQAAGGKAAKGVIDIYPKKQDQKNVTLRLSRLNKLLGIEVPCEDAIKILSSLGFEPAREGNLINCTVPSWRSDVYREADLIEEVARVYGYRKISTEKKIEIEVVPVDKRQRFIDSVGKYLNGSGFYETINVGLVEDSHARLFTADTEIKQHLSVKDETRKDSNLLRQTLIGSLLEVLRTNLNVGNRPCRIYEIADTFIPAEKAKLPIEKTKLSLVCDSDMRTLRGVIEGIILDINRDVKIEFETMDLIWADSGGQFIVDGQFFGTAGIISKSIRDSYGLKDTIPCAAELEFDRLFSLDKSAIKIKPLAKFPAIQRDLSVVVEEGVYWSDIEKAVLSKAPPELERLHFVDIYRGDAIPPAHKSVTLSLRFRDEDGTLTHETVDRFEKAIVENLDNSVGGKLRTL